MNEFADYLPKDKLGIKERTAFFHEHAGWSYDPATETPEEGRQRSAERLAVAELLIERVGAWVEWGDDWAIQHHATEFGSDEYPNGNPVTCEFAALHLGDADDDVIASLGCIDDADDVYRRIVAATLALEAMDALIVAAQPTKEASETTKTLDREMS